VDDAQLERPPLLGGQSPHRMAQQRSQRIRFAALVHPLVVLALGERGLQAHSLARG
jgi:hypothetical protein